LEVERAGAGRALREEAGVASPLREVGKAEVAPHGDAPIAVSVVDRLHGRSVRIGVVAVEAGGTPERFQRGRILAVFPVEGDSGRGQIVVAGGRTGRAMLPPVTVRCLLLGCEAV